MDWKIVAIIIVGMIGFSMMVAGEVLFFMMAAIELLHKCQ